MIGLVPTRLIYFFAGVVAVFSPKAFGGSVSAPLLPVPQSATVVVQDSSSWLVTEFVGAIGCSEIVLDSMNPFGSVFSIHWSADHPTLDSAATAVCQKATRYRRVDQIQLLRMPRIPPIQTFVPSGAGSDLMVYVPDSVSFSSGIEVRTLAIRKVVAPSQSMSQCMVATLPPYGSHAQAVDFLKGKVGLARAILRLNPITTNYLARKTCVEPLSKSVGILPIWNLYWPSYLGSLSSWNDPRVPSNFAWPSPGNAADLYGEEALPFSIDTLSTTRGKTAGIAFGTTWNYQTGLKGYLYRGEALNFSKCGSTTGNGPQVQNDTLVTDGLNLLITNQQPSCGRRDVDMFAGQQSEWFVVLPMTGESLDTVFRHIASAESNWSWPMEGDSILVRGQKVALSELPPVSGIDPIHREASDFKVGLRGRSIHFELGYPSEINLLDAVGRNLSHGNFPAGRSVVELPQGVHGLVVVQAGSDRRAVVAP